VVRQDQSTGTLLWELRNSNSAGPANITFNYGPNGAIPVVGDWDGNRTTTVGIVRRSAATGVIGATLNARIDATDTIAQGVEGLLGDMVKAAADVVISL
jgi:hypothetical protein